jgi:putative transposase
MDGGGTWYHPQACATLGLKHRLHSTFEKSIVERAIEYAKKDRTECLDDYYYPCIKKETMQFIICLSMDDR